MEMTPEGAGKEMIGAGAILMPGGMHPIGAKPSGVLVLRILMAARAIGIMV
jgi:hypothetical protein